MVKTVLKLLLLPVIAVSCIQVTRENSHFTWEKFIMDGHRTGATAPNANNREEALGTVDDGSYFAPNGKIYQGGCVADVVDAMTDVQEKMRHLKEVIGYSPREMQSHYPESELSNMAVDLIASETARLTGKKVDMGIMNMFGIRVNMPKGDVVLDDIKSMFPFKNYLSYVELKGSDLEEIFKFLARRRRPECLSGVKFVINGNRVGELLIGGKPLDREKTYGVATIDFLLDGGDSLYVAKNARKLIVCKQTIVDVVEPYIRNFAAEGKNIEYFTDGRVEIINPGWK